jgi:hypothetical protein
MRRWSLLVAGVLLVIVGLVLATAPASRADSHTTTTLRAVRCTPGLYCHQVKIVTRDLGPVSIVQRWRRGHIMESRTPGVHWTHWHVVAISIRADR